MTLAAVHPRMLGDPLLFENSVGYPLAVLSPKVLKECKGHWTAYIVFSNGV